MISLLKTFFLITAITISANAQTFPSPFQRLLIQTKMQFSMPPNFRAAPVLNNENVVYDFAIKSNTTELEIRFRIWPVEKKEKNPNALYVPMLVTMGLNISNGQMMKPRQYPTESVKKEFRADAGSSGLVPVSSEFGKGYKQCLISVIHKDNIADAYVFYLYNEQKTILAALTTDNIYHALKFK